MQAKQSKKVQTNAIDQHSKITFGSELIAFKYAMVLPSAYQSWMPNDGCLWSSSPVPAIPRTTSNYLYSLYQLYQTSKTENHITSKQKKILYWQYINKRKIEN